MASRQEEGPVYCVRAGGRINQTMKRGDTERHSLSLKSCTAAECGVMRRTVGVVESKFDLVSAEYRVGRAAQPRQGGAAHWRTSHPPLSTLHPIQKFNFLPPFHQSSTLKLNYILVNLCIFCQCLYHRGPSKKHLRVLSHVRILITKKELYLYTSHFCVSFGTFKICKLCPQPFPLLLACP